MKRLELLLILLFLSGLCLLNAQIWQVEITSATPEGITAAVHITNNTNSVINWTFGSPDWLHMFLDGSDGYIITPPVVIPVTIPVGTTLTQNVGFSQYNYSPPHLITPGTHTVQIFRSPIYPDETGWIAVNNIMTVVIGDPANQVSYRLHISQVTQQAISGVLLITNNSIETITWTFGDPSWAGLLLDGQPCDFGTLPVITQVVIGAGQTINQGVFYSLMGNVPPEDIPSGTHSVQAWRQRITTDEPFMVPVGNIIPVNVGDANPLLAYDLIVTGVSQQAVTALVSITNYSDQVINWSFDDWKWIDLYLDGQDDGGEPAMIPTNISLIAGQTIVKPLSFTILSIFPVPIPIPIGTHTVQAYRKRINPQEAAWVAVGNAETVEVVHSPGLIEYELELTSASNQAIICTMNITNNTNADQEWSTGTMNLFVDDMDDYSAIEPEVITMNFPIGATISETLTYAPAGVIPNGTYLAQAKQLNYQDDEYIWVPLNYPMVVEVNGTTLDSNELQGPMQVCAYPNPFINQLNLSMKTKTPQRAVLEIYNIKGQLINSISSMNKSGDNTLSWNGRDLNSKPTQAGIYLIKLKSGVKVQTMKCVKLN